MALIVGVNGQDGSGHDACATLVVDGRVVASVEEERISRIKRGRGCSPCGAIAEVLAIGGLTLADVDAVAYPWDPRLAGSGDEEARHMVAGWLPGIARDSIHFVPHHKAHAFSGIPFIPEVSEQSSARVLVLDGSGESGGGEAFNWDGGTLSGLFALSTSSSLGIYYEALTRYLGFSWGEEGKVMGLSSYGRDRGLEAPPPEVELLASRDGCSPLTGTAYENMVRTVAESFHKAFGDLVTFNDRADAAYACQEAVAQKVFSLAEAALGSADTLVYVGGVALNCAINGRLAQKLKERGVRLLVPPAANDSGTALGAAIALAVQMGDAVAPASAYLGRSIDAQHAEKALGASGVHVKAATSDQLAEALVENDWVVGWLDGGAEIGPRSLGARSIIARPDSVRVRDRVNFTKGREAWRPLAPSISSDAFHDNMIGVPSAYMLHACRVRDAAQERLAGVTHVDGTSRPQTVDAGSAYWELLEAVGKASGSPSVLCTSFNRAGEPMVYSVDEAFTAARAMGLDALAGGGWIASLAG